MISREKISDYPVIVKYTKTQNMM